MTNNQENEYICSTCKSNMNLEKVIEFEKNQNTSFIPLKIRRTKNIGFIFTKDSVLFHLHTTHFTHHNWGKLSEIEEKLAEEKNKILKDQSISLL